MRSLKSRLLLGTGMVIAMGLIASSITVYSVSSSAFYHEFDNALLEKARMLAALTEYDEDGIGTDFVNSDFTEFSREQRPHYFQLWLADDRVLQRSQSLDRGDLFKANFPPNKARFGSVSLPDGRAGRRRESRPTVRSSGYYHGPAGRQVLNTGARELVARRLER